LIVADAGLLIAFARLDLLALLPEMFGTVLASEIVINYPAASCEEFDLKRIDSIAFVMQDRA
jgi:hypothetical protein